MGNPAFAHLNSGNQGTALIDGNTRVLYRELNARIDALARFVLGGRADLAEERIAFIIPASIDYVTALLGIWRAGGVALPLNCAAAIQELEHYLASAGVTRLIADNCGQDLTDLCRRLGIELITRANAFAANPETNVELPSPTGDRRAMILFTSGTTNKPKGVVITHQAVHAQVTTLVEAWRWDSADVIPLFLPLHHVHGIINVLCCALWSGATVHLMPKLDLPALCKQVADNTFNVFMAVPTIYVKLTEHLTRLDAAEAQKICAGFGRMRLNVSGSAACPVKLFSQWQALTGQVLLERYGMTEIGMALSNPYAGERRAGYVGQPLPGVAVALFDENDQPITKEGQPGEIRIKGDTVFREYWDNEKATAKSFKNAWFCSGDIAVIEDGYYRIMGRNCVDIIKSGGYKLSALEIEGVLLTHDDIREVAVLGVEDETWGEAVVAVLALRDGASLDLADLKQWCTGRMSKYKIPKQIKILDALPRNAMGKVTKPDLKKLL